MSGKEMRKHALRRYFIARIKLIELTHLYLLWGELYEGKQPPKNIMGHNADDFKESLRVPCLCWFATLVDKSKDGLDIFELWLTLFPPYRKRIREVRQSAEPAWDVLRTFRDKAGFHADKPNAYWDAYVGLKNNSKAVIAALQEFMKLATFLLRQEEKALPDFESEVDSVLLDVELRHPEWKIKNRKALKKRFGLPVEENFRRYFPRQ